MLRLLVVSSLSSQFIQPHNSEAKQVPLDPIWVSSITTYVARYSYKKELPSHCVYSEARYARINQILEIPKARRMEKETTLLSRLNKSYYNDGLGVLIR